MKVRVIKEFIDKHTRVYHPVGQELTISQERYGELRLAGRFVEKVKTEEKEEGKENG